MRTLLILASMVLSVSGYALQAKSGFSTALEAFKKGPSDANRAAVIAAAQTLKARPEASEEAERFEGRAEYVFKNAKSEADFVAAAEEYRKAVDAAPWLAPNYFNLGVAQEKAGQLAEAKSSFEWYLKAAPQAEDAKAVRKRVAGLEFGLERANTPKARAEKVLAALKASRYAGPVVQRLECGVNLNQYWTCTESEARGSNWVDVLPRGEEMAVNPVTFELSDPEKGIIFFKAGRGASACGTVNGSTVESVAWANCGAPHPGETIAFTTNAAGQGLFRWVYSCQNNNGTITDRCRRMNLIFQQ